MTPDEQRARYRELADAKYSKNSLSLAEQQEFAALGVEERRAARKNP